jgi:hypothetical protein
LCPGRRRKNTVLADRSRCHGAPAGDDAARLIITGLSAGAGQPKKQQREQQQRRMMATVGGRFVLKTALGGH